MAIKTRDGKFKCFFCGEKYPDAGKADDCVLGHKLVYVPMTVTEINQFIQYIYDLQEPPLQLIGRLKKIMRDKAGK